MSGGKSSSSMILSVPMSVVKSSYWWNKVDYILDILVLEIPIEKYRKSEKNQTLL